MARLAELRKTAKKAGIAASDIRGASAEELQAMLDAQSSNGPVKKSVAKKTVRKATTRKVSRKPKRATKATTARKKSAPATSRKSGTAKRQATQSSGKGRTLVSKSGVEYTSYYQPKGTRNVIEGVDFGMTEGWSPRAGSVPDRIIKALKKTKGNREKAFEILNAKIGDFVPTKLRSGRKPNKAERENMLRYRISSTAWRFALQTGQHEKAEGRAKYGTAGTGEGKFKPAKKAPKATATKPKAQPRKTGRKATAARTTRKKATRKASAATKAVATKRASRKR